jgi:hypothetical protein
MEIVDETKVVQNSDEMNKKEIVWFKDIEYVEPNEREKEMLKGTLNTTELLKSEEEEVVLKTEQELIKEKCTQIKLCALFKMNEKLIQNTSYFSNDKKVRLLELMNEINVTYSNEKLIEEFNKICALKLFDEKFDSSKYSV